jgi:hypothetical protein
MTRFGRDPGVATKSFARGDFLPAWLHMVTCLGTPVPVLDRGLDLAIL